MVNALKQYNSNVKFTVYPEVYHDSWKNAYDDPEFYKWLLAQKKHKFKPIVLSQKKSLGTNLFARETVFGWAISGVCDAPSNEITSSFFASTSDDLLKRFWEIEEPPAQSSLFSTDPYELHFCKTTSRQADGRFQVTLLKKPDALELQNSSRQARRCFFAMETKFASQ